MARANENGRGLGAMCTRGAAVGRALTSGNWKLSLLCAGALVFATAMAPTKTLARDDAIVGAIIGAAAGAIIASGIANARPRYPPPRHRAVRPRHRAPAAAQHVRRAPSDQPKPVQAISDPFAGEAPARIRRARN